MRPTTRPRAPRPRRRSPTKEKPRPRSRPSQRQPRQPAARSLDHQLKDPLAAGRRQRGRDRALYLQDRDAAARYQRRAADAGDGRAGPGARARPKDSNAAPVMPAPAAPSMTSPTPIGRQSNHTPAPNLLDAAQARDPASTGALVTGNDVTGTIPDPRAGRARHDHAGQDRPGAGAAERKTAGSALQVQCCAPPS